METDGSSGRDRQADVGSGASSETGAAPWLDPALDRTQIRPIDETVERAELQRWYRAMRLARTFEDRLALMYRQRKIEGAVYLGTGQEATSVGGVSLLKDGDQWSTVARNVAGWFLRGVEPGPVLARWLGKDEAPNHGRDLGLFLADLENYGLAPYHNGSMASWIPAGAGFALAMKRRETDNVYLAFTGDGATSPGDFYEGLNLAALLKLPLVVCVENNGYAYSTPTSQQMPVRDVAERAAAFGIPSSVGFGSDVFEVRHLLRTAIDHARQRGGPSIVEFKCMRRRGHGEHDDMGYVPDEQRAFWEARDPIALFHDYLTREGGFAVEELDRVDAACVEEVDEAVKYAEARPLPEPSSVTAGVFA